MSLRSGLLALAAAVLCALVAGNEVAVENLLQDRNAGRIVANGVGLVQWNVYDMQGDFRTAAIAGLVTFLVVVAVLATVVGGSRKPAALVGGFGTPIVAGMASGLVRGLIIDLPGPVEDRVINVMGAGAVGALPFAWLIAIAVAVGARVDPKSATGGRGASPPPGPASGDAPPAQPVWQASTPPSYGTADPTTVQAQPGAAPGYDPTQAQPAAPAPGYDPTQAQPAAPQPGYDPTQAQPAAPQPGYDPTKAPPPAAPTPDDPTQVPPPAGPAPGQGSSGGGGFTIGPPPDRRT